MPLATPLLVQACQHLRKSSPGPPRDRALARRSPRSGASARQAMACWSRESGLALADRQREEEQKPVQHQQRRDDAHDEGKRENSA
jgi:hypothetical protein